MESLVKQFADLLAKEGRGLSLRSGDKVLVGIGFAEEAVLWFKHRGAIILGFEGFRTDGASLYALLEYIADFSAIRGAPEERVGRCADAALMVLRKWDHGPEFVEFILTAPDSFG